MTGRTPNAYFESSVLTADPVELTGMLYDGAVAAVEDARTHLAAGDIAERSRAITRGHEILMELLGSLNHEAGGEFSQRLAGLYDYIMRLLLDANVKQADGPLAEAHKLLTTLAEGWREMQKARSAEPAPDTVEAEPEPVLAGAGSPWGWGYAAEQSAQERSWSV